MITMTESALKSKFVPVTLRKFDKMSVEDRKSVV